MRIKFYIIALNAMLIFAGCESKSNNYSVNEYGTITEYNGNETSLVIPSVINGKTITSIAESVFRDKGIESVTIPHSITLIGYHAFLGNSLTSISIGQDVLLGIKSELEFHFAFDEDFDNYYNNNYMKAGTYVFIDSKWQLKE